MQNRGHFYQENDGLSLLVKLENSIVRVSGKNKLASTRIVVIYIKIIVVHQVKLTSRSVVKGDQIGQLESHIHLQDQITNICKPQILNTNNTCLTYNIVSAQNLRIYAVKFTHPSVDSVIRLV